MPESLPNASDQQQVEEGQRDEKSDAEQRQEDLCVVLESRPGRRVLWRYLTLAGVFRSSYTGDAEGTIFNEGKRLIGNSIMGDITSAKPDALMQMMVEARNEAEEMERRKAARAEQGESD